MCCSRPERTAEMRRVAADDRKQTQRLLSGANQRWSQWPTSGVFLPVSSDGTERQLSGTGFAAGYDWDWKGFRALQRTKASDAGTRVGSETELWGFVLWLGREAAVRS